MARVRFDNGTYRAIPVKALDNGAWLMEMREHGCRFSIGTEVRIEQHEIIEMAAAEMPMVSEPADDGLGQLEADMAAERLTLTPVAELLGKTREFAHDAPDKKAPQGET